MARAENDPQSQTSKVIFYNGRPEGFGIRIHLNADTPCIGLNSLPEKQAEINQALGKVFTGFSIQNINRNNPPGDIEELVFKRVRGFIGNVIQAETYLSEVGSLKAVASGGMGLINALVAAGAMELEYGLVVVKKQSELAVAARRDFAGGMFSIDLNRIKDAQVRKQIVAGVKALEGQEDPEGEMGRNFFVECAKDKRMIYVGAHHGDPADNLGLVRQQSQKVNPLELIGEEASLGTPLMRCCEQGFSDVLARINLTEPKIPVVGGSGRIVQTPEEIKKEIILELTTFRNKTTIRRSLGQLGVRGPIEIGLKEVPKDNKNTVFLIVTSIIIGAATFYGFVFRKRRQKVKSV